MWHVYSPRARQTTRCGHLWYLTYGSVVGGYKCYVGPTTWLQVANMSGVAPSDSESPSTVGVLASSVIYEGKSATLLRTRKLLRTEGAITHSTAKYPRFCFPNAAVSTKGSCCVGGARAATTSETRRRWSKETQFARLLFLSAPYIPCNFCN